MIPEQPVVKKVLFFALTLLCVVGMEMLFKQQMTQASMAVIKYIQEAKLFQKPRMDNYLIFWHYVGQVGFLMFLICCLFPLISRQGSYYFIASFSVGLTTCSILRLAFREPRPFMVDLQVFPLVCDLTYGTPNAEIMLTT